MKTKLIVDKLDPDIKTPSKSYSKGLPVYIEWIDAVAMDDEGWKQKSHVDEFMADKDNVIRQLGYILKEDKNYLLLCYAIHDDGGDNDYSGLFKLPKVWIKKRISLTRHVRK